jgi:hypothetical protein
MSPANMVPSVKILAVKVRFGIRKEAKMLPTFLKCFPGVETLHVMVTNSQTIIIFHIQHHFNDLDQHIVRVHINSFCDP